MEVVDNFLSSAVQEENGEQQKSGKVMTCEWINALIFSLSLSSIINHLPDSYIVPHLLKTAEDENLFTTSIGANTRKY